MADEPRVELADAINATEPTKLNQDQVDPNNSDLEPGEIRDDVLPPSRAPSPKPISRHATQFDAFPVDAVSRFGKTLTLIIGPEAKHFTVHADRLTSMSEYFRIALKGDWQEAKNDTFTLPEENASVFGFFLEWLYDPHLRYNGANDTFRFLVEAYLLGERRGVRAFRNVIISEINSRWPQNVFSCLDIYTLVFTETTEDSKLRQLVIDHVVWEGKLEDVEARAQAGEVMHPELAMALYTGILRRVKPGFQTPKYDVCNNSIYQVHDFHCGRKGCGKTPELAHKQDDVAYLAPVHSAPYKIGFCQRYHEHKPGEVITGGFGGSTCNTRVYL